MQSELSRRAKKTQRPGHPKKQSTVVLRWIAVLLQGSLRSCCFLPSALDRFPPDGGTKVLAIEAVYCVFPLSLVGLFCKAWQWLLWSGGSVHSASVAPATRNMRCYQCRFGFVDFCRAIIGDLYTPRLERYYDICVIAGYYRLSGEAPSPK